MKDRVEIIGIGMAVLKKNGKPYFTDRPYFPVVWTEIKTYHRYFPTNNTEGYVADYVIEDFETNYKVKPIKNFEKEIAEFILE